MSVRKREAPRRRGLEPDFPLWRIRRQRRRVQDLHEILKDVDDGCFVRVEPAGKLFLKASSFFASSRVPSNVSRIFTKARMTRLRRGFGVAGKHFDSRSLETLGRITMRPMQSIQRRPRTSYSSALRACCEERSPLESAVLSKGVRSVCGASVLA